MKNDYHILLVDDEPVLMDLMEETLHNEGFHRISKAVNGIDCLKVCRLQRIDLIVLDIMLPDLDGFEVCRQIRTFSNVPILFLSARSDLADRITGLAMGADDYICKPFSPKELAFRIQARYRRDHLFSQDADEKLIHAGGCVINPVAGTVEKSGKEVELTALEYNLLLYLAQNKDRIISKENLYEAVWKEPYFSAANSVMVHIRHLRQKLEDDPSNPVFLQTVKGLGYRLRSNPEERDGQGN